MAVEHFMKGLYFFRVCVIAFCFGFQGLAPIRSEAVPVRGEWLLPTCPRLPAMQRAQPVVKAAVDGAGKGACHAPEWRLQLRRARPA